MTDTTECLTRPRPARHERGLDGGPSIAQERGTLLHALLHALLNLLLRHCSIPGHVQGEGVRQSTSIGEMITAKCPIIVTIVESNVHFDDISCIVVLHTLLKI